MGVFGRAAAAAAGALVVLAVPSLSRAATPPSRDDPCARGGRDTCGTTGVGSYASSRYGVRWYGDYRDAVRGRQHLFCIDLRFWYASPRYRYRPAPAAPLRNRAGARVSAAHRHDIAYAVSRYGQSTRPAQQAAVMLYVHSSMGDARPGELDPSALGPRAATLLRRIARDTARYAGPYRVRLDVAGKLVVGRPATATLRVVSAAGAALPGVPLSLAVAGASGAPTAIRTNASGAARLRLVPTAASGLSIRVRTGPLPATEPLVFAPTAGAARANGQRLVAASTQRLSETLSRAVVAAPRLSASAAPRSTSVGSSISDTVTVRGLGGAASSIRVELWGPFSRSAEIACTGRPMWSGTIESTGNTAAATTTTTAPVLLERAGYYGYRVSIPTAANVVGTSTECGAPTQVAFAVAHPSLVTAASSAVVRRGASSTGRVVVRGLGRTPATVVAELYGPFGSRTAVRCDHSHLMWRKSLAVSGDSTIRTPPVRLARTGFYGYREQIAAGSTVAATRTACAPAAATVLAAPEIVTGRGDVATPTAASPAGAPHRPVRVRIPSLGIDAPVAPAGIDLAHGVLGVPADIHRLGWWRDGAAPGDAAGTVLVAGHVDSASEGLGALFPLRDARRGAAVQVDTASGGRVAYRIVSSHLYAKAALPLSVFAPGGSPRLVLVTCGGRFDAASGHYPDDLVVIAVPER